MTRISDAATNRETFHDDDRAVIEAGYTPQLNRSLGFFSSFAVSFSFMSVLMGVFANYGYVLGKAGPFGLWTWLIVGCGQLLVALVFAEMAARVPLTGAIYNWNSRLANPTIGWFIAWILFFAYAIGYVGVVVAMFGPLQTFFGAEFAPNTIRITGVGIFFMLAAINIYGVKLATYMNKLAVGAEIIALIVFGAILLAVTLMHGETHAELLTTVPSQPVPYWPSFLMASLMAAWTIFGFESPSDLAEETVNVRRITPRSIISSVVATVLLGCFFIGVITLAIPDVASVTAATDPISTIVSYHLGGAATKIFIVFVLVAMFASSIIGTTAASRIVFAAARDKNFRGASLLSQVSAHRVPKVAILLVTVVQIAAFLLFQNSPDLYAAPVVLLSAAYLITVVNFVFGIGKLPVNNGFSLGRWHWPVVTLAVLWLIGLIGILTLPEELHSVAVIAGGIAGAGVLFYFAAGHRRKSA